MYINGGERSVYLFAICCNKTAVMTTQQSLHVWVASPLYRPVHLCTAKRTLQVIKRTRIPSFTFLQHQNIFTDKSLLLEWLELSLLFHFRHSFSVLCKLLSQIVQIFDLFLLDLEPIEVLQFGSFLGLLASSGRSRAARGGVD